VNYPVCDFSLSVRPIPEACPQCGNAYLLFRERKSGNVFACDRAGCGFEKPAGAVPELVEIVPEAPPEEPAARKATAETSPRRKPTAKRKAAKRTPAAPRTKRAAKAQ
jgi:predicted RNA-binding Zn-ribbon protein involved in translation (DUF1610 family)